MEVGTFHGLAQGIYWRMVIFNIESAGCVCVWKSMAFDEFCVLVVYLCFDR